MRGAPEPSVQGGSKGPYCFARGIEVHGKNLFFLKTRSVLVSNVVVCEGFRTRFCRDGKPSFDHKGLHGQSFALWSGCRA